MALSMDRNTLTPLVGIVILALLVSASAPTAGQQPVEPPGKPWWDDFLTIVQTGNTERAAAAHAVAALCGAADDPCWGIFHQRIRNVSYPGRVAALHERGLKAITWIECFGTTQAHIVQLKRDANGAWVRYPSDPSLTRVFCNAWGWKAFDGTGEVRWVGVHNYFEPEDFARPYTRLHPRYGCPPMTYPDGRLAVGYARTRAQPWTHRVFDAACAKNVLGRVHFENRELNRARGDADAESDGFMDVPDPGFTPEEWARRRRERLIGLETLRFSVGKDSACPLWIDYLRASIRQALDLGIDGVWADNFSPWDSLGACPLNKAFGEWSVAGFRRYLGETFAPERLRDIGVTDWKSFDVRQHLREQCRKWGGVPDNLRDNTWRDPRWLDDPVWRAYVIYKRQTGTRALSRFYRTIKEEAAAAGEPDFLIMGNDIPMFGLGWPRGDLDMVSTELSWSWSLTGGSRGLMPPPLGSYVPVYKLAREHARSRFVNIWMYVPKEQQAKPNIARVLYYQGLATHALPMPHYPHRRDVGDEATDAAFFGFVRRAAHTFADRLPIEEVGLYFSSSSQLASLTPRGFLSFNDQTHAFSFWGWGTALTWQHVAWRAVPEWKLTAETLGGLRVLTVPNAAVFPAEDVPVLEQWVYAGGVLVLAGECGLRQGEKGNFDRAPGGSTLAPLAAAASGREPGRLGKGVVVCLTEDPGVRFYKATDRRLEMMSPFATVLDQATAISGPLLLDAPGVPWHVALTPYLDAKARRLFVDVNNTNIDLTNDTVTPTQNLTLTVTLPPSLRGQTLQARVLSPDELPEVRMRRLSDGRVALDLSPLSVYACVVIERQH